MKKLNKILCIVLLFIPSLIWANLGEGVTMLADTGRGFATTILVVGVSLWLLPIAFATLVYIVQKKKAKQMHEKIGFKVFVKSLLAGVLGAAIAFYLVGKVGINAAGTNEIPIDADNKLLKGNAFLLKVMIEKSVEGM